MFRIRDAAPDGQIDRDETLTLRAKFCPAKDHAYELRAPGPPRCHLLKYRRLPNVIIHSDDDYQGILDTIGGGVRRKHHKRHDHQQEKEYMKAALKQLAEREKIASYNAFVALRLVRACSLR